MIRLVEANVDQMPIVKLLFREYAASLHFDLGFQGFAEELENFPGKYAPPHGAILLAYVDDSVAGCVALRPLDPGICEMKRMFVKPDFQGTGIGKILSSGALEKARSLGYGKMRLDTIATMEAAIAMYRSYGFYEISAYRENPVPGASYWEKDLRR